MKAIAIRLARTVVGWYLCWLYNSEHKHWLKEEEKREKADNDE